MVKANGITVDEYDEAEAKINFSEQLTCIQKFYKRIANVKHKVIQDAVSEFQTKYRLIVFKHFNMTTWMNKHHDSDDAAFEQLSLQLQSDSQSFMCNLFKELNLHVPSVCEL